MKVFLAFPLILFIILGCSSGDEASISTIEKHPSSSVDQAIELEDFHFFYKGKIDNQYEVEMCIHSKGDSVKGYYVYKKYGVQIPLLGRLDKEANTIELMEFGDPNIASSTGTFLGSFSNDFGISGKWTDSKGTKEMSFELLKEREMFVWFTLDIPFHPYHVNQTFSWEGDSGPIDFSNLNVQAQEYEKGTDSPIELYPDSSGYTIDLGDEAFVMRDIFFQYSLLAQDEDKFIVSTLECGGGTGIFSDIRVLHVDGYIIELTDDFAGGDRCNNGLFDCIYEKGIVYYSTNITPEDLLIIGEDETAADYEIELEWCAVCCVGTANYEYNVETQKSKLTSITVETDYFSYAEGYPEATQCFFKGIEDYVDSNTNEIMIADFEKLIQEIIESCMISKD